jgi:hypothetical protein
VTRGHSVELIVELVDGESDLRRRLEKQTVWYPEGLEIGVAPVKPNVAGRSWMSGLLEARRMD